MKVKTKRPRGQRVHVGLKTPLPRAVMDFVSVDCQLCDLDALVEATKRAPNDSDIDAFIERCEHEASVFLSAHLDQNCEIEKPEFLKHPVTGKVFEATDLLLKRGDMIPFTADGTQIQTVASAPAVVNDPRLVEETPAHVRANLLQLQAVLNQSPMDADQLTETITGLDARSRSLLRKYVHVVELAELSQDAAQANALKAGVSLSLSEVASWRDGRPKNKALYVLAAAISHALRELKIEPTTYPQGSLIKVMDVVRDMADRHAQENDLKVKLPAIPRDIRNLLP